LAVFLLGVTMALVAPRGRKHLSADALFRTVRSGFSAIPDYRLSDTEISLTDALIAHSAPLWNLLILF
jgi:hypothetical protein